MVRSRLEAFSDGVIAIILTIMVLDLKVPASSEITALRPLIPTFLGYTLSFIHVGISWNNHHHTFQAVRAVNGAALLANLHLLFWLSLVPFATNWMGLSKFAKWPVAVYGVVLLLSAIAYYTMIRVLIRHEGKDSTLAKAIAGDFKGKLSLVLYAIAIPAAWLHPWISCAIYITVAAIWLIPDLRIEKTISNEKR